MVTLDLTFTVIFKDLIQKSIDMTLLEVTERVFERKICHSFKNEDSYLKSEGWSSNYLENDLQSQFSGYQVVALDGPNSFYRSNFPVIMRVIQAPGIMEN